MAADYFAVSGEIKPTLYGTKQLTVISVPPEQVFSRVEDLISKRRNSMAAATAETLLCLKYWIQVPEAHPRSSWRHPNSTDSPISS
jgi:hypothetical protein